MALHGSSSISFFRDERERRIERERERDGRRKRETFTDDSFGIDGALLGEGFLPTAASSPSAIAFARSPSGVLGPPSNSTQWPSLIEDGEVGPTRRDASSRDAPATFCLPPRRTSSFALLVRSSFRETPGPLSLSPGQIARLVSIDSRTCEFTSRRIFSRAL